MLLKQELKVNDAFKLVQMDLKIIVSAQTCSTHTEVEIEKGFCCWTCTYIILVEGAQLKNNTSVSCFDYSVRESQLSEKVLDFCALMKLQHVLIYILVYMYNILGCLKFLKCIRIAILSQLVSVLTWWTS